jgi:D-aspartate ligase
MHNSNPVVVLGGPGHSSMCIVRSLGRLGVAVYSVDPTSGAFASFSRYCRGKFLWNENAPAEESVQFLLDLGERIGQRSILIATSDITATFVADNAEALKEWFIFPDVSSGLVHSLCSKKELYHLAKQLGIPTPEAAFPSSRREVLDFLPTAALPITFKGIDGYRLSKCCGTSIFVAQTESEVLGIYDSIEDPQNPNLMLQEYIPGGDETVCGLEGYFNKASECVFAVTGKKLRQWPAYKGVTTLGICLKNETIENMTREFVKKIHYKGVLDIGYRYDARDGLYKLLDVNPRIGCTFRLFVAENGMDVARALYLDLLGQPIPPAEAREGRKWIVEDLDVLSSLRYLLDGKLTFKQWVMSFVGIQETAFFALDDPLPFIAMCLNRGKGLLKQIAKKLTGYRAGQARPAYPQRDKHRSSITRCSSNPENTEVVAPIGLVSHKPQGFASTQPAATTAVRKQ